MSINYKEFLESLIDEINMMCPHDSNPFGGMEPEEWGRYLRRDDVEDLRDRIKDFINNME